MARIFSKRKTVLVIIGWSLLVHAPRITSPLLDYHAWRQCVTADMARNFARRGMNFFQPEIDGEGPLRRAQMELPLYSYLLAILYKVLGMHDILGRLLSCLFAAWGAVWLYELVAARLNDRIALWSALALCAIPLHIYFTRTVQRESMVLWAELGFLLYLDRWLYDGERWGDAARAAALGFIAAGIRLPVLCILAPMWLVMGYEKGWGSFRKAAFLAIPPVVILLTGAWYLYTITAPVPVIPLSAHEGRDYLRAIFTWDLWRIHFISRFPELWTTYTGLLFGLIGVGELRRATRRGRPVFWIWWLAATVVHLVAQGQYAIIHQFAAVPMTAPIAVFIGAGIVALWRAAGSAWARAGVAALVIGIPLHATLRIHQWYRLEPLWVFRARAAAAQVSGPDDLYISNYHEGPVLLYYIDREGYNFNLTADPGPVQDIRRFGTRYFISPTAGSWNNHPDWALALGRQGRVVFSDPDFVIYELRP